MIHRFIKLRASTVDDEKRPAYYTALLSSLAVTLVGLVYGCAIVWLGLTGGMTFPPSDAVQLFGGVATALAALLLPVLFVSLHELAPRKRRVFSRISIVFCTLFSAFVGINRFVQLSVVRVSLMQGETEGLTRFLPYDGRSAMFALEMTGWGILLSVAAFFLALSLHKGRLTGIARIMLYVYALIGMTSGIAFILNSPISVVGFAAWGFILYLASGFLFFSLLGYDRHWTRDNSKG